MAQRKKPGDRLEGLRASLEESLVESLPGLVVLDRDLDYGGDVGVDLVAADPAGALTLVLLTEGGGEQPILAALDVLAFARREGPLLERHLGRENLNMELPTRVILVADSFDHVLRERLIPLAAARVELFELFEIKSAAATRSYLVPRGPGAMEQRDGHSVAAFLDSLPEENRALAALALRRIGRIDTDLAVQPAEDGVSWLLAGELLCAMEWGTEGLNAQTVSGEPTVIGDEGDLDSFLEQVLGDYVAGLDKVGQTAERGAGDGPGDGPADQDEGEGWLDLDQVDKLSSEALLTPEEIEAFRD